VRNFRLASWQRRRLVAALKRVRDARVAKRIVALLELDQGTPAVDVAAHLGVTRQTLYNWIRRFGVGGELRTLHDRARCGRPPKLSGALRRVVAWLLMQPPGAFGYSAQGWTASLLRDVLAVWMGVHISARTIRRVLHGVNQVWKRPRYVLRPDPDREKKTPNSPTDRATSPAQRHPRRGRDRPSSLPAPARRMGAARRAGQGLAHRSQREPSALRDHQPPDRTSGGNAPPAGEVA
jgi:transposase